MKLPRVMIAAPKSGSGKTVLTCGLLDLFKEKGTDIASYKCGPDYIDPMFHRSVIGVPGSNLDTFFSSDEEIRNILASSECEAAVLEGVMGIYDGIVGADGRGSCYDVASATDTPIILVMDVKGMGQTMLSLIRGIILDDADELIGGIVLNRISEHYYSVIEPEIAETLKKISAARKRDVRLLGGIPDSKKIVLESRHLGLMMPDEIEGLRDMVRAAGELIEAHLDMDAVREIMAGAGELPDQTLMDDVHTDGPVLAVARDEAFCFYYEENLRLLRKMGVIIREFSPLRDSKIPEDADGLLLGGGYPELYAEKLSANQEMMDSIRSAIASGMPSLAECGGFMALMDELEDSAGRVFKMAGVISGRTRNTGKLGRFGYVTVTGKNKGSDGKENDGRHRKQELNQSDHDDLLGGLSIRGHEFHYFDSTNNGEDATAVKPGSGRSWECIHSGADHIWGYPHLYYPSCPELIERFTEVMKEYRANREGGDRDE
ncbi:MAG: cobyrinate a,c-diamide synthase [Clostridiales bacterium]|nr:cobyrinate a,c-diamide synthase [Clostridiales bacterium]